MKKVMLKRPESRKLEDWVLANKDKIRTNGWTQDRAASEANKELSMTLYNGNHISGAFRTLGLPWASNGSTRCGANNYVKNSDFKVLLEEFTSLAEKLGNKPSPALEQLKLKYQQA